MDRHIQEEQWSGKAIESVSVSSRRIPLVPRVSAGPSADTAAALLIGRGQRNHSLKTNCVASPL